MCVGEKWEGRGGKKVKGRGKERKGGGGERMRQRGREENSVKKRVLQHNIPGVQSNKVRHMDFKLLYTPYKVSLIVKL